MDRPQILIGATAAIMAGGITYITPDNWVPYILGGMVLTALTLRQKPVRDRIVPYLERKYEETSPNRKRGSNSDLSNKF